MSVVGVEVEVGGEALCGGRWWLGLMMDRKQDRGYGGREEMDGTGLCAGGGSRCR